MQLVGSSSAPSSTWRPMWCWSGWPPNHRNALDPTDVFPDPEEKPESPKAATVAGTALLVGAVLDGIPESIAIGVSLHAEGPSLGLVLLAAVFLGNVPESLGSAAAMRGEGRTRGYIIGVWTAVAVVCTAA